MIFTINSKLLEASVLAILVESDSYGYKITQDAKSLLSVSESTLYPVLRRLLQEELVSTYNEIVDGRNPILAHEFLGEHVEGMDVLIVDDMISSGESMLDIAIELKKRKAKKVYCAATFGLFASGLKSFNEAYEKGYIDKVFCTNLIYRTPELLQQKWFEEVNLSKFVALLIDAINHDASLSSLMNPTAKINKLLSDNK